MKRKLLLMVFYQLFGKIRFFYSRFRAVQNEISKEYNIEVEVQQVHLNSLWGLKAKAVVIKIHQYRITIDRIVVSLHFSALLKGKHIRQNLVIDVGNIKVDLVRGEFDSQKSEQSNLLFQCIRFFENKLYPIFTRLCKTDIHDNFKKLRIRRFTVTAFQKSYHLTNLIAENNNFSAECEICTQYGNPVSIFHVEINNNPQENCLVFNIGKAGDHHLGFDSVKAILSSETHVSGDSILNLDFTFNNLIVNRRWLGDNRYDFPFIAFKGKVRCSGDTGLFSYDSDLTVNNFPFSCHISNVEDSPDSIVIIVYADIDVRDFINQFKFSSGIRFESINIEGTFFLRARMLFQRKNSYESYFDLDVLENTVTIENPESFHLNYLNNSFFFSRIDRNSTIHEILVRNSGAESFQVINNYGVNLVNLIIFSEDPNFYSHKGIDTYFIGRAITDNLVKRRFNRGGSTITMQLSRNLFLGFQKSFERKVEEIILSLLLENVVLISKNRILEIYLSIIEFAPGVYGIKNATDFYFGKKIEDITLLEIIVLTYIIPRPLHFFNAVAEGSRKLENNLQRYIPAFARALLANQIITQDQFDLLGTKIEFTMGSAIIIFP